MSLGAALDEHIKQPLAATTVDVGTIVRHRYVLEQIIGVGGDSVVFRARDLHRAAPEETADGLIALKVLRPERRCDPFALSRLKRSFIQMQCLTHPRIARVFDLDSDGDIWFISMELISGRNIKAWMPGPESLTQRLKVVGACCEALEYAHSMGIIHGDLKPSNVVGTEDGDAKMIDFGSVRTARAGTDTGIDLSAAATVSYASPQVLAGRNAEWRDDIFSLACLSYELLSNGSHPFGGRSSLDAWRAGISPAIVPDMPAHLFKVLARGLSLEREQRPRSARDFYNALMESASSRRNISADDSSVLASNLRGIIKDRVLAPIRVKALPLLLSHLAAAKVFLRSLVRPVRQSAIRLPKAVTHLTLSAMAKPLCASLLPVVRSAYGMVAGMVQMALVMLIVGLAVLGLAREALHEGTVAGQGLPPPTAHSIPYPSPHPAAVLASGKSAQPEPPVISRPPAVLHAAGIVGFESATVSAGAAQSLVAIPVRRSRSTQGPGAVAWAIEDGSTQPDVDYGAISSNVIKFFEGQEVRVLFIPLKSETTADARGPRTFTVSLRKVAGGPALGPLSRVTVTIAPDADFKRSATDSQSDGQYR